MNKKNQKEERVFVIHYILRDEAGEVLDSTESDQPFYFLEGAQQILPALENKISALSAGDEVEVKLSIDEAYGPSDEKMKMDVPRSELAHLADLKEGSYLRLDLADKAKVVRVSKISDQFVSLDGNHPLADKSLIFKIQILQIRPATEEEISHKHAHGPGGHH